MYSRAEDDEYSTEHLSDMDPFYMEMAQNVKLLKYQQPKKNRRRKNTPAENTNYSDQEEPDIPENEDIISLMISVSDIDKQIEEKINKCRVISGLLVTTFKHNN